MHLSKKLLISFIFLTTFFVKAQISDSIPFNKGLNIGFDISGIITKLINNDIEDYGGWLSWDFNRKYKIALQLGTTSMSTRNSNISYASKGRYSLLGFDYNFYKKGKPNNIDMVYIGLFYGYADMQHQTYYYKIEDKYWEKLESSLPKSNIYAGWLCFHFGIRVELMKNIQLGWNVNFNKLLNKTGDSKVDPLNIAGYGQGNSSSNFGFNYGIFYKIPFY
jgi:hypothetical protein